MFCGRVISEVIGNHTTHTPFIVRIKKGWNSGGVSIKCFKCGENFNNYVDFGKYIFLFLQLWCSKFPLKTSTHITCTYYKHNYVKKNTHVNYKYTKLRRIRENVTMQIFKLRYHQNWSPKDHYAVTLWTTRTIRDLFKIKLMTNYILILNELESEADISLR